MKCTILLLFVVFWIPEPLFGQFYPNQYRPPAQNWQELRSEHFRIIFPAGAESLAFRSAHILEQQYPKAQKSVGGSLHNFPVILNTENDLSGGFVTAFNYRTEIEVPPRKGKTMNPQSGDWLDLVLSHELVHALHLSVNPTGLTSALGLFSPDIRRSIHIAAPLGVLEGIAVEHETRHVVEGGGRGNYPFFTNKFHTTLERGHHWSMGQLFQVSSRTRPFDRHYAGSYPFFYWLQENHGAGTAKEAIAFHYNWPFLGFGFSLRRVTGEWPGSLYRSFIENSRRIAEESLKNREKFTDDSSYFMDHGGEGAEIRRPLWMDQDHILMYGSFYNKPEGFYIYHISEQEFTLLLEHRSVEDYRFSYDSAHQVLHFADYVTEGRYDNTFVSRLFLYDLKEKSKSRVTDQPRLFAPSPGSPYLALQTDHSGNRLVSVENEGGLMVIAEPDSVSSIIEVQQHPVFKDHLAIIARKGTVQALWISDPEDVQLSLDTEPDIAFDGGSVFDLNWHPEEKKLLFSSDFTGTLNIYEYDLQSMQVIQLTQSRFNAFEASYSPDGTKIAHILHDKNHYLPVILNEADFLNRKLPESEWISNPAKTNMRRNYFTESDGASAGNDWDIEKYRTGFSWLKPRTFLPGIEKKSDGSTQVGLRAYSSDLLARHTYSLEANHSYNRFWFDADYRYTGFHPGVGFSFFSMPSRIQLGGSGLNDTPVQFLLQDLGASVHIPFRYYLERNTRQSSISVTPRYKISQLRFFHSDRMDIPLTDFGSIHKISLNIVFNYRLRQFTRDLQPNAGWVFFGQTDYDLNELPFDFNTDEVTFANILTKRKGLRFGLYRYIAPLGRWNQSLRIGAQVLTQTEFGQYDSSSLVTNAFRGNIFGVSNNLGFFDTRYTIPLLFPDEGGLLIPIYVSNLYLVLFSQTVADISESSFTPGSYRSRTAVGAGIRASIRLSNLTFDLGIGFGFEPAENQWNFMVGPF